MAEVYLKMYSSSNMVEKSDLGSFHLIFHRKTTLHAANTEHLCTCIRRSVINYALNQRLWIISGRESPLELYNN